MLSSIDFKSGEPNWTTFQNQAIDNSFRIREFLGGDEKSAAFTARPLGDPDTNAVIRLYPAHDDRAAETQIGWWLRAKELNHPNLVRILGAGRVSEGDSLIYVALEPADERLSSVVAERRLEPDEAAEILKSVTAALQVLHENGFVHGAVSPDQIFAVGDAIKLSAENVHPAGTHEELFADTPKFVAPESRGVNATAASDVWCVGATLYECLTQEVPDGSEFHHTNLPEPHRTLVRRALDPDPKSRATLKEIEEIEEGRRTAAAAATVAAAPLPEATPAADSPAASALGTTEAASEIPAATKPSEPAATVPPAAPDVSIGVTPVEETSRPPVFEPRKEVKAPREGVPVWAYGVGIVVILLGLIFLLRPRNSSQNPAPPAAAPVLPSAQQKVIPPAGSAPAAASPSKSAEAAEQRRAKPSPTGRPAQTAASGTAVNGDVWRVIVYTYNARDDAERRVDAINRKYPKLKAEVFSPSEGRAPYLVAIGGAMSRDQAKRVRQTALGSGMPRDSYLQNFTH